MFIEQSLPLSDHTKYMVVDNHFNDRNLISGSCCQLIHVHSETTVSGNIDHYSVRTAELGTKCCPKAIAHGSETAGRNKLSWFLIFIKLCSPHLVLPNFCANDRITVCCLINTLDNPRSCQYLVIVSHRITRLHLTNMTHPRLMILLRQFLIQSLKNNFGIAFN